MNRNAIAFYFDFSSPYSYIASEWIEAMAARHGRTVDWKAILLGATFLLGLGFVATEIWEFRALALAGAGPSRSGWLSAFFTLVGTHMAQVGIGLIWIVVLAGEAALRGLNPFVVSRLYRLGLFWHFLVIGWVSIFSVVYLPALF